MTGISDESIDAAANLHDFLTLFLDHRAAGTVRDLGWYLQRFGGDDANLAREYLALTEPTGARPDDLFAGRYRILRELGRGGQGVVSLALDTLLDRTVALKTIDVFGRRVDRLRREAEIVGSLDHPCLCTIFEANFGHATPYVAMRYVEGETLARMLARRRVEHAEGREPEHESFPLLPRTGAEVERVLATVERVARALHVAHEAGIVHRDIKPSNLVIAVDGDPVLLDFGLASHDAGDTPPITLTGEALGTPAYMSPEQIRGSQQLGRSTDVYSLGVTLYECLTLVQPFDRPSLSGIESAVLNGTVARASALNRALPRELDAVLAVALERDAHRRYATAEHFAEDLHRVATRQPIRAAPPGALRRSVRWVQRNPVVSVALVVLSALLTLVGGLLVNAEQLGDDRLAELLAREAIEHASANPSYAFAVATEAHRRAPDTLSSNNALLSAIFHHRKTLDISRLTEASLDWERERLVTAADGQILLRDTRTWEQTTSLPYDGEILRLDLSPDGKRLLAGDDSGHVTLWDLDTGLVVSRWSLGRSAISLLVGAWDAGRVFAGDQAGRLLTWTFGDDVDGVTELHAYSTRLSRKGKLDHEGARLVSFSSMYSSIPADTVAHVWDTRSGRLLQTFAGHAEPIIDAAFSPDGAWLATASKDGTARVWDARSGACLAALVHPAKVLGVSFGKDGETLATCCDPGDLAVESGESAFVWNWRTDSDQPTLVLHQQGGRATYSIAHDAVGARVAALSLAGSATVWDARTGEELDRCRTAQVLTDIRWSPDGEYIAMTQKVLGYVWGLERSPPRPLTGHRGPVLQARFSPDGARALTASADGTARIWDVARGVCLATLAHGEVVRCAGFSSDGRAALTGGDDGDAALWRAGERVATLGPHAGGVTHVRFLDDGRCVTATDAGELRLWDGQGRPLRRWSGHDAAIEQLRIAPGGGSLATAGADRSVRLWSPDQDEPTLVSADWIPARTDTSETRVFDLVYSEDGRSLITASQDRHVRRIAIPDGALLSLTADVNLGHMAPIAGGLYAVSSKWNGSVLVLSPELETRSALWPHTSLITHLAVSSEGLVLTTSGDGTGFLMRVEDGVLVPHMQLVGHDGYVTWGEFSPDGRLAITASRDGTARLWPVHPADTELVPRELTQMEREKVGL